jgi:hypothetical protein
VPALKVGICGNGCFDDDDALDCCSNRRARASGLLCGAGVIGKALLMRGGVSIVPYVYSVAYSFHDASSLRDQLHRIFQ